MSFTELVKRKMELRKGIDYTISEVSVRDYRIKQMEEELRKQRAEEKKIRRRIRRNGENKIKGIQEIINSGIYNAKCTSGCDSH